MSNYLQSSHKKLIQLKILILNSHILIIKDKRNKNNLKTQKISSKKYIAKTEKRKNCKIGLENNEKDQI